jgi:hypothetical protein
MPKALGRADMELADAAILGAHRLIHQCLEEKRVSAGLLADLSARLMEASHRLGALSTSPFLTFAPGAHDEPEPKR